MNREGQVQKTTGYIVYGLTVSGMKEILGIWIGEAESSKFWMKVLVDLKNRRLRKVTKTKGSFPREDALFKLLYLVVTEMTAKWTLPVQNWGAIMQQLCIYFGDRIAPYIQNA